MDWCVRVLSFLIFLCLKAGVPKVSFKICPLMLLGSADREVKLVNIGSSWLSLDRESAGQLASL